MSVDVQGGQEMHALGSVGESARTPRSSRRERILLYAIVLLLPVLSMKVTRTIDVLSVFDWLFLPLLLLWTVRKLFGRERILFPSCFRKPLTLLLVGATIATVFATNAVASCYGILIFLRFYLFFQVALDVIEDIEQLRTVLLLLAVGLVFSATIGVVQGLLGVNIKLSDVELNQNTAAAIGGRTVVRTIGTFANSLNFANYVSVTLFTVAVVRVRSSSARRIAAALVALLAVVALLETLSRGPILAAAVGGLVFWGVDMKRHKMLRLVAATTLVGSMVVIPVFGSRVTQSVLGQSLVVRFASVVEQYEFNIRYSLWQETVKVLGDHFVGVGLRNADYRVEWPQAAKAIEGYFPYETRGWKPFNFHFENVYLAVYMNIGIVGFIGAVVLVYRTVAIPFTVFRGASPDAMRRVSRVLGAANVTFAINMVTNPAILSDMRIMILFWTLASCVAVLWRISPRMQAE